MRTLLTTLATRLETGLLSLYVLLAALPVYWVSMRRARMLSRSARTRGARGAGTR